MEFSRVAQTAGTAIYEGLNSLNLTKLETSYANLTVSEDGTTFQALDTKFQFNNLLLIVGALAVSIFALITLRRCVNKMIAALPHSSSPSQSENSTSNKVNAFSTTHRHNNKLLKSQ